MHQSLVLLRVAEDERNLRSRFRLFRLYFDKNLFSGFASICFFGLALFCMRVCYLWTFKTPLQPAGGGQLTTQDWFLFWSFMGLFIVGFGAAGVGFAWGLVTDPLLRWLMNPNAYLFKRGSILRAEFIPGGQGRKKLDRMRVTIKAESENATFTEDFSTHIWFFTDSKRDSQLKKGDDWYDLKGKRPALPLPVHILIPKSSKSRAALIGISAAPVDRALALIRAQQKRESRKNWILLAAILGTAGIILMIKFLRS
jgi:hypothetical protein